MKEKIMNWFKKHEIICGVCLLFVSLCMVAFGFANLGEGTATDDVITTVGLYSEEDVEEFAAE